MTLESFETVAVIKAERDTLRAQVEWCRRAHKCPKSYQNVVELEAENARLETSCAAMREALEKIAYTSTTPGSGGTDLDHAMRWLEKANIARKALEVQE